LRKVGRSPSDRPFLFGFERAAQAASLIHEIVTREANDTRACSNFPAVGGTQGCRLFLGKLAPGREAGRANRKICLGQRGPVSRSVLTNRTPGCAGPDRRRVVVGSLTPRSGHVKTALRL